MRFMLLQNYAPTEVAPEFLGAWAPEDAEAHIAFQRRMNERLLESGELVEAQGMPDNPVGWLIRVASRRMVVLYLIFNEGYLTSGRWPSRIARAGTVS
jgi:hypothetical protein